MTVVEVESGSKEEETGSNFILQQLLEQFAKQSRKFEDMKRDSNQQLDNLQSNIKGDI